MESGEQHSRHMPIEITTHNVYFHEDSPILSADCIGDIVATSGCDNVVRLWNMADENRKYKTSVYKTAAESSIHFELCQELSGFSKPVNCIRFCGDYSIDGSGYLLAACSDGGKVIVYESDKQPVVVRPENGDDSYDLCWAGDLLIVSFLSGTVEVFRFERIVELDARESAGPQEKSRENESTAEEPSKPASAQMLSFTRVCSKKVHSDAIQGIAFNKKYNLISTFSLDRTQKVFLLRDGSIELLSTIDSNIDTSRGLFKRIHFEDDFLFVFTRHNSLCVYSYPFTETHLQRRIGPLNSSLVKTLSYGGLLYLCTKKSLYIIDQGILVTCIDNSTFLAATDAFILRGILFVSSMDGFLMSVRLRCSVPAGLKSMPDGL